jgi:2-polyprenyl-6-methoxyphenol hydroxylase-like FAD-dependent oxidoreductase
MGGLAAAAFLARSGHKVMLYERFDAPRPVGAGLLLQPTGLSVLALLGLDKKVIAAGSRITRLYGKDSGSAYATLDVHYKHLNANLFGVGIHRGSLFSALYEAVMQSGAGIVATSEIVAIENGTLTDVRGLRFGPFDIIVDASGTKSSLRKHYAEVKRDRTYPFGALWSIATNSGRRFATDMVEQRYKHADRMLGVVPVGRLGGGPDESLAFFWSLKVAGYDRWREQDLSLWQDEVASLWPETEELVRQFKTHDDLAFATYSDVILRKYHAGNVVFIGDAAHSTSPQLGQGANMALMDAMVLAGCVAAEENVPDALKTYETRRKKHIRFYQMASRWLTPFFQSDHVCFARARFLMCGLSCTIPFARRITAHVLTGTKTGLCSTLNPGDWAEDYALFSRSSKARMD